MGYWVSVLPSLSATARRSSSAPSDSDLGHRDTLEVVLGLTLQNWAMPFTNQSIKIIVFFGSITGSYVIKLVEKSLSWLQIKAKDSGKGLQI